VLRKAENGAASLRLQLQAGLTAARPRKKFGFSSRSRGTGDAAAPSAQPAVQSAVQPAAPPVAEPGSQPEARPDRLVSSTHAACQLLPFWTFTPTTMVARPCNRRGMPPCSTLRGLRQQRVVKRAAELAGGDFTLADLEDCTVLLLGRLPALRILQAKRCCIVAGPVDGAAYLEGTHAWLVPLRNSAW
jgi:Tubulin binding cofactor C